MTCHRHPSLNKNVEESFKRSSCGLFQDRKFCIKKLPHAYCQKNGIAVFKAPPHAYE